MNRDEVGISRVERLGWPVRRVTADQTSFPGPRIDGLIVDLAEAVSAEFVKMLRVSNPGALIMLMDGTCAGRLEADLVVAPIDRLPAASSWVGFDGERCQGPEYAILDPAYARVPIRSSRSAEMARVLVTMGASDPCGLTVQALRALDAMPEAFEIVMAIGPAFMHETQLAEWCRTAHHRYAVKREDSLLELMVNADLAVVSFGTTVYELAATGLPAVALSISEDHWQSAEEFARFGGLISLGLFHSVDDAAIQHSVRRLLNDSALCLTMAQRGQAAVDGRGAERVAELLLARIRHPQKSRVEVEVGKSPRA